MNNGYTWYKGHRISIPRYFCDKFGVKKSDLIAVSSNFTVKELEIANDKLIQHFMDDMKRKNRLKNADNETLLRLFEQWYDNSRFSYSEAVWHDFRQKQKLRSKL